MKLTDEQIKIRAFGEEMNQKAREPVETAQEIIDDPALTKKQEDLLLMRENE